MKNFKTIPIFFIILLFLSACNKNGKEYTKLLATADSLFKADNFDDAKAYYSKILQDNPKDERVKKKLVEIASLLEAQQIEMDLKKALLVADDLFDAEAYEEAKKAYEKILLLDPNDEHATNRIKDIEYLVTEELHVTTNPYHIIVGSFRNYNNAAVLQESLQSKGLNPSLISRGEVFTAVSYASYETIHKAYNSLLNIRESLQEEEAWVLKYSLD